MGLRLLPGWLHGDGDSSDTTDGGRCGASYMHAPSETESYEIDKAHDNDRSEWLMRLTVESATVLIASALRLLVWRKGGGDEG